MIIAIVFRDVLPSEDLDFDVDLAGFRHDNRLLGWDEFLRVQRASIRAIGVRSVAL